MSIRILVVEDNDGQYDLLTEAAKGLETKGESYSFERATDAAAAKELLNLNFFDGAILDLRVPDAEGGRATEPLGVGIAEACIREFGLPIVLVSGYLAEIGDDLNAYEMVKQIEKDEEDAFEHALGYFEHHKAMLSALRNARKSIGQSLANTFSRWIWPNWSKLEGELAGDQSQLNEIVTRQLVSHVAELLGIDAKDNPNWHPVECYIRPALYEERAQTGDIFEWQDSIWIVLTPQCDLAVAKAPNVIVAKCEHGKWTDWTTWTCNLIEGNDKKKESAEKAIRNLVNQNLPVSQHFLPPLDDRGPLTVSFGTLNIIPASDLNQMLDKRLASLAATFVPNLTQRFGAYISRPGQPNMDPAHF